MLGCANDSPRLVGYGGYIAKAQRRNTAPGALRAPLGTLTLQPGGSAPFCSAGAALTRATWGWRERDPSHTHRDADLPQDLLRNSLGFLQHLVQGAAVLGAAQGDNAAL